ncbi:hypothetical protein [Rhabdothermincola sp.]|uniref:hypothetical protein n=1 Tax=Rhabdothermincola sp. TaxID=2820405 RepID=UPI002FDF9288
MFRFHRRWRALGALALALSLAACAHPSNTPTAYDDVTRENFIEGCTGIYEVGGTTSTIGAGSSRTVCECAYTWISENVPFDQFEEINTKGGEETTAADALPAEVADGIRQACPGWGEAAATSPTTAGSGPTTSVPQ